MSDDELLDVPHVPLPVETLLIADGVQLLWIDGLMPLPIGTRINLDNIPGHPQVPLDPEQFPNGRADAIVIGINLWGTQGAGRTLVLNVELVEPGAGIFPQGG